VPCPLSHPGVTGAASPSSRRLPRSLTRPDLSARDIRAPFLSPHISGGSAHIPVMRRNIKGDFKLVLRRPIETARLIRTWEGL
jgi:hypothetical protein